MNTSPSSLAERLNSASDPRAIEDLADAVAEHQVAAAAPVLISKLAGSAVRDDDDSFDAVCQALTSLGVMQKLGNMNYRFQPVSGLNTEDAAALTAYRPYLPSGLFA